MLIAQEAQACIVNQTPILDSEKIILAEAENRVLANSVFADADFPPFARSAVDGYAVTAKETPASFFISEIINAGQAPQQTLTAATCARIFTGAALPESADCVVMQEKVRVENNKVQIPKTFCGMNVRQKGEDYKKGDCVLEKDTCLGPAHLAIAASVGETELSVYRQPRTVILSSGDELVPPNLIPSSHQIRDVNTLLLESLVKKDGGKILSSSLLPDDYQQLQTHLQKAVENKTDLILFSGGASAGEKDFTKKLLQDHGFQIHFDQINVRPGKPLIFATRQATVAFGIPGNPVSALVCFYLFIHLAIKKMQGTRDELCLFNSPLGQDFNYSSCSRETFWPARWRSLGNNIQIFPLPWQGSGHIASLANANALMQIPSGVSGPFVKGHSFSWIPL